MKKYRLVLGVILVIALISGNLWLYAFKPVEKVPDLVFKTIKNESFSFNKMAGKPILVTFWATSCGVCMADLPKLIALHDKYAAQGLQMFSVAMPYDDEIAVKAVAKKLPFHVVLDADAVINNAFGQVMYTPTNFLIKPNGDIAFKTFGPFDADKAEMAISKMI